MKLRSSHRRIRLPVHGSTSSKPTTKPPEKLQHGNDRLPKKRKDRR